MDMDYYMQIPSKPGPCMLPPDLAVNKEVAQHEVDEPILADDDISCGPLDDPSMHVPSLSKLKRPKTANRPRTAKRADAGVSAAMDEEQKDSGTQVMDFDDDEEIKEDRDDGLSVIDEEVSDDDNFSCHEGFAPNKVTVGIQTSEIHFKKVGRTSEF